MKLTFNFQTLILLTLTVVLTVATAVWGRWSTGRSTTSSLAASTAS